MFIVVAIVIFGIFVGLAYTAFGSEGLSNDLKGLFTASIEQTTNNIADIQRDYKGILKNNGSRLIYSNDRNRYPLDFETVNEGSETFQRATLSKTSPIDTFSLYSPILEGDLRETAWKGKAIEFSVTFKATAIGQNMRFSYILEEIGSEMEDRQALDSVRVNGEWQTIKIIVPNHEYDPISHNGLLGHLLLHMTKIGENTVDIKEFNIRIAEQ